jgi:hypothetical protein
MEIFTMSLLLCDITICCANFRNYFCRILSVYHKPLLCGSLQKQSTVVRCVRISCPPQLLHTLSYHTFCWCWISEMTAVIILGCFKRFCFEVTLQQEHTLLHTGRLAVYCFHSANEFLLNVPSALIHDVINIPNVRFSSKEELCIMSWIKYHL